MNESDVIEVIDQELENWSRIGRELNEQKGCAPSG